MSSVKIILRNKVNKDGTCPLALQIIKDRKKSVTHLGYNIKASDWDADKQRVKKSHPNSAHLNNFLIARVAEVNNKKLELETAKENASAKAIKNSLLPKEEPMFFVQAEAYLNDLKEAGNFNRYSPEKPRIGHFREFIKGQDIAFSEITPGLLNKFSIFLKSYHIGKENKKAMSERTIVNHLAVIRCVFAYARRNKVIPKGLTPFGGDDGIKIVFPETTKLGLSAEDVEKLEQADLPDFRHDHARNVWLFSFYFAGMRVSDVFRLRWSDFHEGRLHYVMGKNDKGGSLKVPDKAATILDKYRQFKVNYDDLVFPELKGVDLDNEFETKRVIAVKDRAINEVLRKNVASIARLSGIPKMHAARHTFASLAGDTIPIQMLQKLYRHSHVSTTIGYQGNYINKEADEVLDAVINKKPRLIFKKNNFY